MPLKKMNDAATVMLRSTLAHLSSNLVNTDSRECLEKASCLASGLHADSTGVYLFGTTGDLLQETEDLD